MNNILLIDSTFDISSLIEINQYDKIITFDYKTHKNLESNEVEHIVSENFLDSSKFDIIEKLSENFIKWHNESEISPILLYDNVNLGESVLIEFHQYLLPSLKIIFELYEISKNFENPKFFCTPNLYDLMININDNIVKINTKYQTTKFVFDKIEHTYKIWKFSLKINLSKETFIKIKNFSEYFINLILKRKVRKNLKNILFLNFDTIKYNKLFKNNPKFNLILYNRRRPTIWNFHSLSVIKKSNCIIENNFSLKDSSMKNSSCQELNKLKITLSKLKNSESFFESFFSFENIPIWKTIRNNFFLLLEKRFTEAFQEIQYGKKLLKKYNFDFVCTLSENGFYEKIFLSLLKKYNSKIYLLQHGLGYDSPLVPEKIMKIAGTVPEISSKFIAWGNPTKKFLNQIGIHDNKIVTLGSPIYDNFSDLNFDETEKKKYILLITSSPTKWILSDLKIETIERYESTIKKICEIVMKTNKKLIIKVHPDQEELDITSLVKSINKKITILKFADTSKLIKNCDLMISIDISTAIIDAHLYGKPVITIPVKNYNWGKNIIYTSNSCLITNIDNLEKSLSEFQNSSIRENFINNGYSFVKSYIGKPGIAVDNLYDFISKEN